jgi:preprotein translocase subunit Sec63
VVLQFNRKNWLVLVLKTFSIAKGFQTFQNALGVAWDAVPHPAHFLKKVGQKLFYRLRRVLILVWWLIINGFITLVLILK